MFGNAVNYVGTFLSYFCGREVEGKKGYTKERRKGDMDLQSVSRKLVVLGVVAVLLLGMVAVASAIAIDPRPTITLVGDEEPTGKPGHGMISIGDTIVIECTVTPDDSVDYIVADMRKYGGDETEMLSHFAGADGYISNVAFVPICSGEGVGHGTMDVRIVDKRSTSIPSDSWLVCWDAVNTEWDIQGTHTGYIGSTDTGVEFFWIPNPNDTVFGFTITDVANICCLDGTCASCDHFEFETHAAIQADTVWVDTLVVADADSFWIDDTPCNYYGHDDPTVLVTAYALGGYTDTLSSYPPQNEAGAPIDFDTHWTTYLAPWVRLYPTEYRESQDYFFGFDTDNAGFGPIFGEPDHILNPANGVFFLPADECTVYVDVRKLAHANGNDDILYFGWDAHLLGLAYADTNWWQVTNPYYASVSCTPPYGDNGVPPTQVFGYVFPILEDSTDVPAGEQLPMIWISDSGDTTWFPAFTKTLAAIDNQVPNYHDVAATDSVMPWDISFVADMNNAGEPDVLNPASYGNPIPDWLQVKIDLAGLFDLDDVHNDTDPGRIYASFLDIGYYLGMDTPFGFDYLAPLHPLSPIWGSDSVDVLASPPSPYGLDADSVRTWMYIFDNAGNTFFVGGWDTMLAVDNELPIVDASACSTNHYIWTEIAEDVAFKTGQDIANVGMPEYNIHGNEYVDRDRIILHANLGDAFGASEIRDVTLIDNPYCNDPVPFLYDNGLDGADPVLGDKNYTGQTRIQVAGILPGVCILDTDDNEQGFQVLVTDDAGNAAINSSCIQPHVDNEPPWMSPEHVSIMFWDNPDSMGVEGDVNSDGIVNVGDKLVFEWRAEDEVIPDGEIDSVRVNLSSIDPAWSGWVKLYYLWPGGIYRNWWPHGGGPPVGDLFTVMPGTVDGEQLCADFKVWDNAGNTNGWQTFCSDLELDNVSSIIDCAMIDISVSGSDTIAAVGDTVCFSYAGPDEDVEDISIHLYGAADDSVLYLTMDGGAWTGCFVVDEGMIDDPTHYFEVIAEDDAGNKYSCYAGPVALDNIPPTVSCGYVMLRLWDYVNNVPFRIVNAADNLTVVYWDPAGDVVRVTADFSNYGTSIGTDGVVELVPEFDGGALYKWGYRVDPVPDGDIDQGAGGQGTMVLVEVWDDAGNHNSAWVCPKWLAGSHGGLDPIADPGDTLSICNAECLPVDTKRPEPVPPDAITFELLESSNNIANVGDRLKIIVDMGDPTAPGYDMEWEYGFVQADISQYGDEYADLGNYLFLTDRAFSAGGEGDGQFSYHFYYQTAEGRPDGQTLVDGVPILPGATVLPASDPGTKIRVRAMDDAGNFSLTWTESDVLRHSVTHAPVPVDNELPTIDPENIMLTYVDNDANGICDIGDEVTVTVDMTDAPGGDVAGVWANLYDWGYPSMDKIPLTAHSPVYSVTFTAVRNPGNYCEDGVLLEDDVSCRSVALLANSIIHPEVEVMAQDESDNWSGYEWIGPVDDQPFVPEVYPQIDAWPFMPDWTSSGELEQIIADTDAPDPVNPTFNNYDSDVRAYSLQGGAIGIKMFYDKDIRNQDVQRFFVYGDLATPGTVDWNTFLGEPIPVGDIPSSYMGMMHRTYVWVSEPLPERTEPYHFGVLAVDNAGNMSDPLLTWVTGSYADTTAPTGFVQAVDANDHPTDIGGDEAHFLGYLHSDYYEIVYNEWYARIQDVDPLTEGNQPGEWKLIDEDGSWPVFPPYNYLEAPYDCYAYFLDCAADGGHPEDCFDLVPGGCYTFEVCMIPWDTEGNHIMPDDAEKFVFTYDNWAPVMTSWSVDGHPSPSAERWVVGDDLDIVATATDGCDMTENLTWELWLLEVHGASTEIPIDTQTIPVGEPYTFTMDLANYPQGDFELGLLVRDEVGNYVTYTQPLEIQDTTAPEGRFAYWREAAILMGHFSHPEYLKILDGMHVMGRNPVPLAFWVQWPGQIPFSAYDVGQVDVSYQMTGALDDEWTPIATLTSWQDSLSFDGDLWIAYWFGWDTSMFENGAEITLKAEVMDEVGNTTTQMVNVLIDNEYPVLTIDVPEAQEVCGEMRVKGPFNITATETTNPVDTYYALWAYKSHDFPDIGDCDPTDTHGWRIPIDSLMFLDMVTPETIWRATVNPATEGMEDGAYDIVVLTSDVAGNWSWDKDRNFCVDPGYFAEALANGMGMTIVVDNEAPEVRIRSVDTGDHVFEPVDEGWLWPMLPYVGCDGSLTVTSWTASQCDVAKVEYFLVGDPVLDGSKLVAMSTDSGTDFMATFPTSGGICDYLVPGALQNGFVVVSLEAKLTDVLGSVSTYYVDLTLIDLSPASAFIFVPADGECVRDQVELKARVINDDEVYDVTYQMRPAGSLDSWTKIATTRPHDGKPWDTDVNGNKIYWNTALLSDGAYELQAVSRDANLIPDPNPAVITVNVDNHAPVITVTLDEVHTVGEIDFIGGPSVNVDVGVDDGTGCGVECVDIGLKKIEWDPYDWETILAEDCYAPYGVVWNDCGDEKSFCRKKSGMYFIGAEATDKAGNWGFGQTQVYIDHWAPEGWLTEIEDSYGAQQYITPEDPCCCYDFWGVITLTGEAEDNVPNTTDFVGNLKYDSGLAGAQFQYRPYDPETCDYIGLLTATRTEPDYETEWYDLGAPIMGEGPTYTMDWDTGALAPGYYAVRLVPIDVVGNRIDINCGWGYEPTYVCVHIADKIPPVAVIAGVDPVSGYIWAAPQIHGPENDIGFVRFEYMPVGGSAWTVIGEVDECASCGGLYGAPWHPGGLTGQFWVRAVAYDDDYDVVKAPNLYDKNPPKMMVTIASDGTVTMASTDEITSFTRWGNLEVCDKIAYRVESVGKPIVIGVFDNDPEDHFNTPWGLWRDQLIRGDDPTGWYDHFSLNGIDPWGTLTMIATYNDEGIVGAVTNTVKVYKTSEREGTRGPVSQDGMTVDIPSGAFDDLDGLLIIQVPDLMNDPSLDDPITVGHPVMMTFLDHGDCNHYDFSNGVRAKICMNYNESDIPEGYTESDLKIAFWNQWKQEWVFDGCIEMVNTTVDTGANKVCCYVDQTGTYSVVVAPKLRITTPVFDPRCGTYTGVFPTFCSIIEDLSSDYVDEIKVTLDGPAADPIFDNMIIYHGSGGDYEGDGWFAETSYGAGWFGSYDAVANRLCMRLVDPDSWSTYWDYWYGYDDWFMFYGDILSKGLPAGVYTLDIWAQNKMGDTEHLTHTFTVDATAPKVAFVGNYVAPNPSFQLTLTDLQSGVDEDMVYMDVFAVAPYGSDTEYEELLGTATPSAMEFEEGEGSVMVNFGDMVYHNTLPDNMSIDVVVYDGTYENYSGDCSYGECRRYANEHGVPDCARNHATPVWRRFTVDGLPPSMEITSEESATEVEIEICDVASGIDSDSFMISENGGTFTAIRYTDYDWSWKPINNHCGILTIDVGDDAMKIDVQASDMVGNFNTVTIDKGAQVVDVSDMKVYPNPFSPSDGEYARIAYTLSKNAHVTIKIYDFAGVAVKTVVEDQRASGGHVEKWLGVDESGNTVAPGAYIGFVKVDDGSKVVTKNLKIAVGHGQ
jgi:hypothetical protein